MRVLTTVMSCGLNLLIERLGLDPRWTRLMWALIALNEVRGALVVYWVVS